MEVMIAVSLSTLLMSGIMQLLSSSVFAYRLQLSQSQLEESARYARDVLLGHIAQAGYDPEPWLNEQTFTAVTAETLNGDSPSGDRLGLQRWSAYNCYGK